MTAGYTRRGLLRVGGLGSLGLVAGCLGEGDASTSPADPPPNSSFEEIAVDGSDLVAQLRDGHAVSKLNLIGPGGNAIAETEVARGTSAARLQLLDVKPDVGGYEIYEPGTHELVAVTESGSSSIEVELVPDLQINGVEQYRDGDRSSDLGKLAVRIENVGSGPTWVYDITYRGAPNSVVNDELNTNPGLPQLSVPEDPRSLILEPGEQEEFVGDTTPLLFSNQNSQECTGKSQMEVVIGSSVGDNPEIDITISVAGTPKSAGLTGEFTCTSITTQMGEGD